MQSQVSRGNRVPLVSALYGTQLGTLFPVLASLSSFVFQLPLLLILFEYAVFLRQRVEREKNEANPNQVRVKVRRVRKRDKDGIVHETVERVPAPRSYRLQNTRTIILRLVRSPPLVAIVIGLLWGGAFSLTVPLFLDSALESLGAITTPLASLTIGAFAWEHRPTSWSSVSLNSEWKWRTVAYVLAKVFLLPAIALGLAKANVFRLSRAEQQIAVIVAAMPLAVSAFVFAKKFDADASLFASAIVLSTVLALPFCIMWISIV